MATIEELNAAAQAGNAAAQYRLGLCYQKGEGVSQNKKTAIDFYKKAASGGHPDAAFKLGAFYGCSQLKSVAIPNNVTSIGDSAFCYCIRLTSVTIGSKVTSIGDSVFFGCSSLTSITIPNSVTSIGDSAFSSCSALTSVIIGNGVTSIGDWVFSSCSGLSDVYYTGSASDWAAISVGAVSNEFDNATKHYNYVPSNA